MPDYHIEFQVHTVNHAGGGILFEPVDSRWGSRVVIAYPDGNKVEFTQPTN